MVVGLAHSKVVLTLLKKEYMLIITELELIKAGLYPEQNPGARPAFIRSVI